MEKQILVVNDERTQYYDQYGYHSIQSYQDIKYQGLYHIKQLNTIIKLTGDKTMTLEQAYDYLINEYNEIIRLTNGKINFYIYKSMTDCTRTFLKDSIEKCQDIDEEEGKWITLASQGGIRKNLMDIDKSQTLYCYDIKSCYPSILNSWNFYVPITRGVFKISNLTDLSNRLSMGIYRVKVTGHSVFYKHKEESYLTHEDVALAFSCGLNVQLVQDGQPNCLLYHCHKACLKGRDVFGNLIDTLERAKADDPSLKLVKTHLSSLWGTACEATKGRTVRRLIDEDWPDDLVIDEDEDYYEDTKMIRGKIYRIMYIKKRNHPFHCPLARFKPFLLARQRKYMIEKIYLPHKDIIACIKTDGIYTTEKIPEFDVRYPEPGQIGVDRKKPTVNIKIDKNVEDNIQFYDLKL